ncbi:hypothetical protein BGZ98_003557 [Dissophora globulifera]|nr:hypothetical protein BGZ98_003557 [Dissophora globulifera]
MFELADYVQVFSFNGVIRKFEVYQSSRSAAGGGDSRDFVLLEDLGDHFDVSGVRFIRADGVSLALMRDSNLQRLVPERLPASKGSIIYIVANDEAPSHRSSPASPHSPPLTPAALRASPIPAQGMATSSPPPPIPGRRLSRTHHPHGSASSSPIPGAPDPNAFANRDINNDGNNHFQTDTSEGYRSKAYEQPSPVPLNSQLPDWVYTFHNDTQQQQQQQGQQPQRPLPYGDGRRRHSIKSAPYMLPNDLTETERLEAQHYMAQFCFQGNYNVRLDHNAPLKILDVATGTGVWALEMAREFPKAELFGVDISPIYPNSELSANPGTVVPPNCHFQLCNVLDGLPFPDNFFDFIYMRLVVYAFSPAQRKQVNLDLMRVLKPLGHIQLVESDGIVYNAGSTTEMVNALSIETAKKRSVDPTEVQRLKPGLRRVGFTQVRSFCIALPVGGWGGIIGQLSQQNMHGLAKIWLRGELGRKTEDECKSTLEEMDRECELLRSFYRVWLVTGQKPDGWVALP